MVIVANPRQFLVLNRQKDFRMANTLSCPPTRCTKLRRTRAPEEAARSSPLLGIRVRGQHTKTTGRNRDNLQAYCGWGRTLNGSERWRN